MEKNQSNGSVCQDTPDNGEEEKEPVAQYIVVRSDVYRKQDMSCNAILQHTSSASVAAIHKYYHHNHTKEYLKDIDAMRKKVFQVDNEKEISDLEKKLVLYKIDYRTWTKQPENKVCCIATRPYPINEIAPHFKNIRIYKK